jgi:hypothetical protein
MQGMAFPHSKSPDAVPVSWALYLTHQFAACMPFDKKPPGISIPGGPETMPEVAIDLRK